MTDLTPIPTPNAARRRPAGRAGFSFAEVLFAVIILGIGFILVAAIFPVAIQQTQTTAEDAAGAAAAREAASQIAALPTAVPNPIYFPAATAVQLSTVPALAVPTLPLFPPTVKNYSTPTAGQVPPPAIVVPFTGPLWEAARGVLINGTDPRYAYVPFYRRENGSPVAQLIVVAVAARNRTTFDGSVDAVTPLAYQGTAGVVTLHSTAGAPDVLSPDTILFKAPPAWLTEGCYLPTNVNGRSYRLGRALDNQSPSKTFELDAGGGLALAGGTDGLWGTADDILDAPATYNSLGVVPTGTLQPVPAYAGVYTAPGSLAGRITLFRDLGHADGTVTPNVAPDAAVQGSYVVVADDYPYAFSAPTTPNFMEPANAGGLNGHVFRLGPPVPADPTATPPVPPGTFELDLQTPITSLPLNGIYAIPITPVGTSGPTARVYLVGAGRTNPLVKNDPSVTQTLTTYGGLTQAVGVYSTYIPAQ